VDRGDPDLLLFCTDVWHAFLVWIVAFFTSSTNILEILALMLTAAGTELLGPFFAPSLLWALMLACIHTLRRTENNTTGTRTKKFKTPHKGQRRRFRHDNMPRKPRCRRHQHRPTKHTLSYDDPFPDALLSSHLDTASSNTIVRLLDLWTLFSPGPTLLPGAFNLEASSLQHKATLISPSAFNAGLKHLERFSFIWDTGASFTVSPDLADFVDGVTPLNTPILLDGLATGLKIEGRGQVQWVVTKTNGDLVTIHVDAFYTPGASARLLSPQSYLQQCDSKGQPKPVGGLSDKHLSFTWPDNTTLLIPYSLTNNLPVTSVTPMNYIYWQFHN
jgi:hypothetical protein